MAESILAPIAFLLMLGPIGCATAPLPSAPAPTAPPSDNLRAEDTEPAPSAPDEGWQLRLEPDAEASTLRVTIDYPASSVSSWRFPSNVAPVPPQRGPSGRARLSYTVTPHRSGPCPLEISPDAVSFCGAAVLAAPDDGDEPRWLSIDLSADTSFYPRAASSLGIGRAASAKLTWAQLNRVGFLFGAVHHARFDSAVGRDHAAWLGYFSFDPRWVAAEAATIRTEVDRWFGVRRAPDEPSVALLLSSTADTHGEVDIEPLFRGAWVSAGPSAAWSPRARIDLTRHLVQRTIGGALRVRHEGAMWWFDEGFAHAIAVRVLLDGGMITPLDAANEISALLAEDAMHRGRWTLAEAIDAGREGDVDARRWVAGRGALLATAMRMEGMSVGIRDLLATRVKPTAEQLFDAAAKAIGSTVVHKLVQAFEGKGPIPLRAADVSPCLVSTRRVAHRFELGFTLSDDEQRVATVLPTGPAARADLRPGDRVVEVNHVPRRSDVPVEVVVTRDDQRRTLRFLPRGERLHVPALTLRSTRGTCGSTP